MGMFSVPTVWDLEISLMVQRVASKCLCWLGRFAGHILGFLKQRQLAPAELSY